MRSKWYNRKGKKVTLFSVFKRDRSGEGRDYYKTKGGRAVNPWLGGWTPR